MICSTLKSVLIIAFIILSYISVPKKSTAQSLPSGTYSGKWNCDITENKNGLIKTKHYSFEVELYLVKDTNIKTESSYEIIYKVFTKNEEHLRVYASGDFVKSQTEFVITSKITINNSYLLGESNIFHLTISENSNKNLSEKSIALRGKEKYYKNINSINLKFKSRTIESEVRDQFYEMRNAILDEEEFKKDTSRQKSLKITDSYVSIGKFPTKNYSWYMTNSADFVYQIPLYAISNLGFSNYDSIVSNKAYQGDSQLNGKFQIKLYSRGKTRPVTYFSGTFINGKVNGFGFIVTTHPDNISAYYAKEGVWRDGKFMEEDIINKIAIDFSVSIINDSLESKECYFPKAFIKSIEYKRDPLCPDLTNGFEMSCVVYWNSIKGIKDTIVSPNDRVAIVDYPDSSIGICEKWVNFVVSTNDFYDSKLKMRIEGMDSLSRIEYSEKSFSHLSSNFPSQGFFSSEKTFQYDDYLQIRQSPWVWLSSTSCNYRINPIDNYQKIVDFSIRNKRNEKWRFEKRVRFASFIDCRESEKYENGVVRTPILLDASNVQILIDNTSGYEYTGKNYRDLLNNEINEIKHQYPNPVNDTTNLLQIFSWEEKILGILNRINSSGDYNFVAGDTLVGAWLCTYKSELNQNKMIIYLIENSRGEQCKTILLDSLTMNTNKGYQNYIKTQKFNVSGNTIVIKNGESLFHLYNYDDFKVKSIGKNLIEFYNSPYVFWHRLDRMSVKDIENLYNNNRPFPNH